MKIKRENNYCECGDNFIFITFFDDNYNYLGEMMIQNNHNNTYPEEIDVYYSNGNGWVDYETTNNCGI